MAFFPINCITDEEKHEFLRKKQKELASKADKELVGEEEEEEEEESIRQLFGQVNEKGNTYFQGNADYSQLKDWEEHKKSLNKKEVTELIIEPRVYQFNDDELCLSDYKKLVTLYACGLGLRKISFKNLSILRIYLTFNPLTSADDLKDLTTLVSLSLNCVNFASFDARKLINLVSFSFNRNKKSISDLRNRKTFLNCQGLSKLQYLDCSYTGLNELNVEGCESLETLDADCNNFKDLDFPYLPALLNLSLLLNDSQAIIKDKTLYLRSPNLRYLVTKGSNIGEVIHVYGESKLGNLNVIDNETYARIYGTTEESMQAWERVVDETMADNPDENIRNLFGDTHLNFDDQPKETDETKPMLPCTFPLPTPKKGIKEISIPHKGLTGRLIIADYPDLTFINVGNNELEALIIRDCPQLKKLIYAHNNLREPEAEISDCDNLTSANIHKEQCQGGWERPPDLTDEEKKNFENQLDGSQAWAETDQADNTKILAQIICLLAQAETALAQQDYPKLKELIEQLQELVTQVTNPTEVARIQEQISRLEQGLVGQTNSSQPNYWPLIISSIVILPLVFGLVIWLIKKQMKKPKYIKN